MNETTGSSEVRLHPDNENSPVSASELTGAVAFDLPRYLERQAIIDDILARDYPSDEVRVKDLNSHIAAWDDDFGISYTSITGRALPGIEIHGVANALAFSANYAPDANFEDADLDFSVFSLAILPDLKARGATFNHAILPFAVLSGDLRGVSAIKAILNFADIHNLNLRGVDLSAAYLMGTNGLTKEMFESVADVSSAISTAGNIHGSKLILGDALGRFTDVSEEKLSNSLLTPRVFAALNASDKIFNKTNRNRLKGVILDDTVISGSEVSKLDFEGGIWHNIDATRLEAIQSRLAGVVVLASHIDHMVAPGLYAPGLVTINSSFRGSDLPENAAGAVFIDSDLREASIAKMQPGGALVIGGKAPEIDDSNQASIRVVDPAELPSPVMDRISRIRKTTLAVDPVSKHELG